MTILHRFTVASFSALLLFLAGCVQITPSPGVAHAGDTVVLGLGGIVRNWNGEKPRNLQLSITDAANQTFPIEPGTVFQAYPDYRSAVNVSAILRTNDLGLEPYDGAWFVSSTLNDTNGPLNLAPGPATIHVSADNFTVARNATGDIFPQEGDLAQLPIEIIAGPPSPNDSSLQYGAYDERGTHFLVRPTSSTNTTVGGAYYAIQYLDGSLFNEVKPIAFPVSHNPFVKLDFKIHDNGNGTGTYFIYVYNPSGFTTTTPRQPRQAGLPDLGVYLEYFDSGADTMKTNFIVDQANSYFIDIDGNRINGMQTEIIHASDL